MTWFRPQVGLVALTLICSSCAQPSRRVVPETTLAATHLTSKSFCGSYARNLRRVARYAEIVQSRTSCGAWPRSYRISFTLRDTPWNRLPGMGQFDFQDALLDECARLAGDPNRCLLHFHTRDLDFEDNGGWLSPGTDDPGFLEDMLRDAPSQAEMMRWAEDSATREKRPAKAERP